MYQIACTYNGNIQIEITEKRRFFTGSKYHEVVVTDEISGRTYKTKMDGPFEVFYTKEKGR